jgi:hypothetical protein
MVRHGYIQSLSMEENEEHRNLDFVDINNKVAENP